MRYGSICSGIESASAAWLPLGWECAFVSEVDKYANQVLRYHYPGTSNHGDFTQITKEDADGIELIVAGTPCQDFSVAGLREGIAGDRGNLTFEFVRLLERTRPTWLLWENVPGVLSSWSDAEEDPETGWVTQTNDFDQFLAALSELGYEWAWRILDAQFFGVPQRRRRVFLVGHLGSWRGPAAVLFERESLSGHPPPSREEGQEATRLVAPCLNSGGNSGGFRTEPGAHVIPHREIARCVTTREGHRHDHTLETLIPYSAAFSAGQSPTAGSIAFQEEQSPTLRAGSSGTNQVPTTVYSIHARQDPCPAEDIVGNIDTDGTSRAIAFSVNQRREGRLRAVHGSLNGQPSGTQVDGVVENLRVRRLMPIECERLQGFEDGYTERGIDAAGNEVEISDTQRYKMLGNSKAVPVVRWLGERIEMINAMMKRADIAA